MPKTLGQALFNATLPKGLSFDGPVTAKSIQKTLVDLARHDPATYVHTVTELKRLGDEVATVEGISVGLDDIAPHYEKRNPVMKNALAQMKKATTDAQRRKIITDTQGHIKTVTENHPGDMTLMTRSGGRGTTAQLMKTVSSPVGANNYKGELVPWLINHSYSEGLRPGEYWVAGDEARQNVVEGKIAVTEPGEVGKLMISTMIDQVVSSSDCGTNNGITVSADDTADLVDRLLARPVAGFPKDTIITSQVIQALKKAKVKQVAVRSPMTCLVGKGGVCQKCMGLTGRGRLHPIGQNVGVRAAQAMSEPLTQMTLSAKHGTRIAKDEDVKLQGLPAVKALLNVPKSFMFGATLAHEDGKVTRIEAAPQGGNYVYVNSTQHYVPPHLPMKAEVGHTVEAGDSLSHGIPRPDEIVLHKGMGVGRKHLVDHLHEVYRDANIDLDKRHLELLAKAQLNFVEVEHDPRDEFHPSEVISFNSIRHRLNEHAEEMEIDKAEGKRLAEDYHHYSAGTRVTPAVIAALKPQFPKVHVTTDPIQFKFVMHSLERTPLLREDWMARLSHRYLKDAILQGAHYGETSDIHGYHPVPGFAFGVEFGNGGDGAY